jgi:peptidoglycan/xylan/chitin deacetylase (PgdA/CDA1 family)
VDPEKVQLLKTWLAAGYELGNHTFSHLDFHKVTYDRFINDILKGEKVCNPLTMGFNKDYKYFRHPFLHVGLSKEKYDSLSEFLAQHGYVEAPVTIDNDDYIFAYAYSKAMYAEDEDMMKKIGADYVDYMENKLIYFENQSTKLFDRNVKQILLLHANALNAAYLDELAERFQQCGYHFISMEAALQDEAYETQITHYGKWGISWIDRWALSAGKKSDFFEGDPPTPDYVKAVLEKK